MRFFARLAATALMALSAPCVFAAAIWFSAGDALYRLESGSTQPVLMANPGSITALAADAKDGSVWAIVGSRAVKYSEAGNLLVDVDLKGLGFQNPGGLSLDPYNSTVWLADGKVLAHLDAAGSVVGTFAVPGVVRLLSLGVEEDVWLLGNKQLWRYSSQGALLANADIGAQTKDATKLLAVDSLGGVLWVAGEKQLLALNISNLAQVAANVSAAAVIRDLALDPRRSVAWTLTDSAIAALAKDGSVVKTIDLRSLNVRPLALIFDPSSDSLWLPHGSGLIRFTSAGELGATVDTSAPVSAVSVTPFVLTPSVSILKPPRNALTNNARPEFRLGYDALCSGTACGFAPAYFGSYALSALLNGQAVSSLFTFDATTGQSSFIPSTRLPEGSNTFSASAQDSFGHRSESVTNAFTVDTIPPKFLTLSPAEGSTVSTPGVLIQGTVDDPTATVVLSTAGSSQHGSSFSFPVTLQPGLNTFCHLSA